MIDPQQVSDVHAEELLARYVLYSSHIRASNQTIEPDAFIPHPYQDLSVTRHLSATSVEHWSVGNTVAQQIGKQLHGRADFEAAACLRQRLQVIAAPVSGNANHAEVRGWPLDKATQKIIAQEIAAVAVFVARASS